MNNWYCINVTLILAQVVYHVTVCVCVCETVLTGAMSLRMRSSVCVYVRESVCV